MIKRSYRMWIWLVMLLLVPVILWILPGDFFDNSNVILCPSRFFFNAECPGCGMTRAVMHFHHFQINQSLYYNAGSIVVYPVLCFAWAQNVYRTVRGIRSPGTEAKKDKG